MELHPQPRPARAASRAWDPAPHDPAADPQAQRQGRALPADARPRVGRRAALPRLRRPRGGTAHLAAALQLYPQPQLDLRPAAYQPRSGPAEAQHLAPTARAVAPGPGWRRMRTPGGRPAQTPPSEAPARSRQPTAAGDG